MNIVGFLITAMCIVLLLALFQMIGDKTVVNNRMASEVVKVIMICFTIIIIVFWLTTTNSQLFTITF